MSAADMHRTGAPRGAQRALDARSGADGADTVDNGAPGHDGREEAP